MTFPLWPPHQGYDPLNSQIILGTRGLILITFATSQWMVVWVSGYHASTLITSVEQHWNSPFINWGSWLIWIKKQPLGGYGHLLAAEALLMVLKLYLIVNYYYNTLFLFFLFIREVISLIFFVLNLYAWEIIFRSIASFSARIPSTKHLFDILLSFLFFA